MKGASHHRAEFSQFDKTGMANSASMTMLNGVGMCLLSFKTGKLVPLVFGLQLGGLVLFSGCV